MGFNLFLIFITSWFLHLCGRIPFLGAIHFDLLLVIAIFASILFSTPGENLLYDDSGTGKILKILCLYIILTIPFVQWPGSVLREGLPNFVRAVVFFYFTISLVTTERRLKTFIAVFIACQTFRIFEPVYLHITSGYWGSLASMSDWEFMHRLSGAPSDIVNPNGLAFIIDTVIPFFYFLSLTSRKWAVAALISIPISLYALVLTGSRSGFICLLPIMIGIYLKGKHRAAIVGCFAIILIIGLVHLSANQEDRYLSIFDSNTRNAVTAEGRIKGIESDLRVALGRPIVGHGIGTSREANANFAHIDKPSHDLYTETAEELGFVGLVIFLFFIKSVITNAIKVNKMLDQHRTERPYLATVGDAMLIWLFMNLLFSLASYGLSSYEWYLFGGLTVVLAKLAVNVVSSENVLGMLVNTAH